MFGSIHAWMYLILLCPSARYICCTVLIKNQKKKKIKWCILVEISKHVLLKKYILCAAANYQWVFMDLFKKWNFVHIPPYNRRWKNQPIFLGFLSGWKNRGVFWEHFEENRDKVLVVICHLLEGYTWYLLVSSLQGISRANLEFICYINMLEWLLPFFFLYLIFT